MQPKNVMQITLKSPANGPQGYALTNMPCVSTFKSISPIMNAFLYKKVVYKKVVSALALKSEESWKIFLVDLSGFKLFTSG